jgi:hypothetical protein
VRRYAADANFSGMTEHPYQIRGGCLCGAVRYQITAPFRRANFCHCSRCRKHSGAAALAQGRVPISDFVLLQGRQMLVSYTEPGHMAKVFCGCCGSSLFGGTWPTVLRSRSPRNAR